MDLRRCEFDIDAARSTASVSVDGKSRNDWSFHMQAFPPIVDDAVNEDRHWITVSRGPVEDIVDADGEFTETTFSRRDFSKDEWSAILAAPAPSFELLTVGDLIPIDSKDAFEAAGGVIF
jgi:4'-phosphopantetheinyl transferase